MKMKKFSMLLTAFVLTLIVLTGCTDNTAKDETPKKQSANNAVTSTITSGGAVTVGISQDLDSLDPHKAVYAGTKEVLFNVYEGLVKPTAEGDLVPAVAEKFEISKDAKTYTFTLREGLTFHDGSKVTAEDVKYSIERYADIQGKDSAFSILEKVVIVDEKTVKVELKEGNSEFLSELSLAVLPKDNKEPAKNPVGTGPFKIKRFDKGQQLLVRRFENYRDKKLPYLDEVTFKIVANTDAAFTELQGGNLDIVQYLTEDQIKTLGDKFEIVEGSVNYVQALYLNNKFEPFQDKRVRQALCYAVDRNAINEFVFGGKSHIIGTNMIPGFKKYYNTETEKAYEKNIEKAKELLKEAGYEKGFDLTVIVPDNYGPHKTVAEVIVEQLKEIGVNAKIKMMEFTSWVSEVYGGRKYEATIVAVDGTLAPSSWFEKNVSTAPKNFTNFKNEEFDKIFKQAKASIDDEEKITLYKKLQTILAEDAASVYIQDPVNLIAVNKKLSGYKCYPVAAQDLSEVGFTAK
ncbi:MAG: ABC transporter substrate-binding protein [Lachnospiraceae bacterium]|nr:ABC transporter substrate-binding protein [Lachnospiraceae bacterium]